MASSFSETIEDGLTANFETETYRYFLHDGDCPTPNSSTEKSQTKLEVKIKSATSTRGRNLVGDGAQDRTGLMIWPATHLLCQFLVSSSISLGDHSAHCLELGCGCGLVGVVASLVGRRETPPSLRWISTDMDDKALDLSRLNLKLNGINCDAGDGSVGVMKLSWGDEFDMHRIQEDLISRTIGRSSKSFDHVCAADIVYPATANQVLALLFVTVERLLKKDGTFWLAFCSRDGHRTPTRLISAATEAGFAISIASFTVSREIKEQLPPLLDAKLLKIARCPDAKERNEELGLDGCSVFPGLKSAIRREEEEESSEEEWSAPFLDEEAEQQHSPSY